MEGAEERLYDDLRWAGLQWDEGPDVGGPNGPYKQSLRNDVYKKYALDLLSEGQAYRCFCTPQTAGEAKAAYVTSGCYQNCSSLSGEQSQDKAVDREQNFTVRLHQPTDAHKRQYPDLIYGNIQRLKRSPSAPLAVSEDDAALNASDTVLVKSDGTPTYHFANVVDDHLMGITHVIRGSEWMASTPLHYDIYSAFNWTPPQFAHVGLLVDQNLAKLSKRNSDLALDVASMRYKHGILPAPLINFLALLGWSNPTNNDVMELDDLVRNFDLKFTRGNAMVRMEKLWFLQKAHVAKQCERASTAGEITPIQPLVNELVSEIPQIYPEHLVNTALSSPDAGPSTALQTYTTSILLADPKSFQSNTQFLTRNRYFFAFSPSEVPPEQDFYDKAQTITPSHLKPIIANLFTQPWAALLSDEDGTSTTPHATLERTIHHHLSLSTWLHILTHPNFINNGLPPPRVSPAAVERLENLLPESANSPDAIARYAVGSEGGAEDVEAWVRRFRVVNGALMKYLREKLALGLPGPHVSVLVAVLGREECARRLGVDEIPGM